MVILDNVGGVVEAPATNGGRGRGRVCTRRWLYNATTTKLVTTMVTFDVGSGSNIGDSDCLSYDNSRVGGWASCSGWRLVWMESAARRVVASAVKAKSVERRQRMPFEYRGGESRGIGCGSNNSGYDLSKGGGSRGRG